MSERRGTAIAIGAVTGTASGLLGVGGAVLMVPMMVRFAGLAQHRAHGTSLAVVLFTAAAALAGYARAGHLDLVLAATLVAGSVLGAPLGARGAQGLPAHQLRRAFGVLVLLVGLRLFLTRIPEWQVLPVEGLAGVAAHVGLGFAIGAMSGFFGVGGGVVLVPALVLLSGVPQHLAQGVSLLFIVPTAAVGAWTHRRLGNLEGRLVPALVVSSMAAAFAASFVASALPGGTLRFLFGCLLIAVGLRLVLSRPRPAASTGGRTSSGQHR